MLRLLRLRNRFHPSFLFLLPSANPPQREVSSKLSPRSEVQSLLTQAKAAKSAQKLGLESYLKRAAQQVGTTIKWSVSDVRRVLYLCAKLPREPESTLHRLLQQISAMDLTAAKSVDLSLLLYTLSILDRRRWLFTVRETRDRVLNRLLLELSHEDRIHGLNGVDLVQILYSFALLGIGDAKLVSSLCQRLLDSSILASLRGRECANLLWALGKMKCKDKVVLKAVSERNLECWMSMTNREKAMSFWSWGTSGLAYQSFACSALKEVIKEEGKPLYFDARQLSTILMACARLQLTNERLKLNQIVQSVVDLMEKEDIGEQCLANITWALGKINYHNQAHIDKLVQEATRPGMLRSFTSQGLSNVLSGWALLQVQDEDAIETLVAEVVAPARLPFFKNQELAVLNWSLGKLQFQSISLLDELVSISTQNHKLKEYSVEELSAILTGWIGIGLGDQFLIYKVLKEALDPVRIKKYNANDLSILVWSMHGLNFQITKFYEVICSELSKKHRIVQISPSSLKKALDGFQDCKAVHQAVKYWIADVVEHWMSSGKLAKFSVSDLKCILSTLTNVRNINPLLLLPIQKELSRKSHPEGGL